MKSREQIKQANEALDILKDYIELAKTQKRLRVTEDIETLDAMLQDAVKLVKTIIEEL